MNFLQFLKEDTTVAKYKKEEVTEESFTFNKNPVKNESSTPDLKENIYSEYKEISLKAGDFIKVIRPSLRTSDAHRLCDIYCGYHGIIKTRFKSTDYATVILDAPNHNPRVYIPIEFLEKIN
jgi:hypothetical protein